MKDDFHVDMSGRIYLGRTIGVALVGAGTKAHYGCALKGNIIKFIKTNLLNESAFEIINIGEFRKRLGRNVGSLADNYAKIYRRRALKMNRQIKGKPLNVVPATYKIIKQYWEELNKK